MTKTMRFWLAALLALAAVALTAAPSPAAERKPVRSGTITGWGVTWPAWGWGISSMFTGTAIDCDGNPECRAWLGSGCNPALAGRDPAVTASIVNVAKIANGTTAREFAWRAGDRVDLPEGARAGRDLAWSDGGPLLPSHGGVVVQLWSKDCEEIHWWPSWSRREPGTGTPLHRMRTTFPIPSAAKWMTVTTNDTADLRWTLT